MYHNFLKRERNKGGASSSNARVELHLNLKDDGQAGSSQKCDDNIEANLALKDDAFDGLDDINHLEAEDFFGDCNWRLIIEIGNDKMNNVVLFLLNVSVLKFSFVKFCTSYSVFLFFWQ